MEDYAGKFTINRVMVQDVVQEKDTIPTRPGKAIAADLFSYMGRKYLVITDKYSGWPELFDFRRQGVNSEDVEAISSWSMAMGVPNCLTSDNGS